MQHRAFHDQVDARVLGQALSATYTQSWSEIFKTCERVVYVLIAHASCDVLFNAQIASDASGTGNADAAGADIAAAVAGKMHTIEITPGILTTAKQFVSAKVTRSAGTYTLLELKMALRNPGTVTPDTTWATQRFAA